MTNKWFVWTWCIFGLDGLRSRPISHLCWLILATINDKKLMDPDWNVWMASCETGDEMIVYFLKNQTVQGFLEDISTSCTFQIIRQSCVPALLTEVRGTFSGTDAVSSILVAPFLFGKVIKNGIMPWLQPQGVLWCQDFLNKRIPEHRLVGGLRKHQFLRENSNFCGRDYSY